MRIIAGAYRGHRLAALGKGDAGAHLRPTPDRVRESLFSVLGARVDWTGVAVLDLFAGTGALGLEALSRGAAHVTFVENGRVGIRLISENIDKLRVDAQTDILRVDATRLPDARRGFDVIFMDPPYGKGFGEKAIAVALRRQWCTSEALIVWEDNQFQDAPEGVRVLDRRHYGETHVTLMETHG